MTSLTFKYISEVGGFEASIEIKRTAICNGILVNEVVLMWRREIEIVDVDVLFHRMIMLH